VLPNKDAFPQWYRIADVRRKDGTVVRRAIVSAVSPASFRAHMDVYRRNQVVPLVILLHHTFVKGQATGHFTAARVSNDTYRHWVGTKRLRADMKTRLAKVERVLPCMEDDLTQYVSRPPSPDHTPGEGSVYEPSGTTSADSVQTDDYTSAKPAKEDSTMTGSEQGSAAAASNSEQSNDDRASKGDTPSPPSFNLLPNFSASPLRQSSCLSSSIYSILSTNSQSYLTPESFLAQRPGSPRSQTLPPAGAQEDALIEQLRARPPYDDALTRQMRRAYTSNNTAFETWRARQKKANPSVFEAIRTAQGPIRATEQLQDRIGALIELVHALPYPEVHVATLPDAVLKRVGQAAITVGVIQLLHRVQDQLSTASQPFCHTWLEALTSASPADTRWGLAQASDHWERLDKAAAKKRISLPPRTRHGIGEEEWCKLAAYLLIVPDCLPWEFMDHPVPQRCDALIAWLAATERAEVVTRTATAIHERDWLAGRRLFPAPLDGGLSSEQTGAQGRAELGAGVTNSQQ
jgi:hypothetical protein